MLGAILLRIDMKPSTPMTLIAVQISSTNGAIPRGANRYARTRLATPTAGR